MGTRRTKARGTRSSWLQREFKATLSNLVKFCLKQKEEGIELQGSVLAQGPEFKSQCFKTGGGSDKMAQWTKVLALQDGNSSLRPRIHTGTRKNQLRGGE